MDTTKDEYKEREDDKRLQEIEDRTLPEYDIQD